MKISSCRFLLLLLVPLAAAKEIIVTWGGNRINSQTQDPNYYEPSLESVCTKSNYATAVHVMGVLQFYTASSSKVSIGMGLANHCNKVYSGFSRVGSGYSVLSCPNLGSQIKKCQSLGKRVLISLGTPNSAYNNSNDNHLIFSK